MKYGDILISGTKHQVYRHGKVDVEPTATSKVKGSKIAHTNGLVPRS